MTDYYVDSETDNVVKSGSKEFPFKTLQEFMDLGLTGDLSAHSLNLAKGSHWRETLTMTDANGSATRKFKISSYSEGSKPKINGADLCSGFVIDAPSNTIYKNTSTTSDQDIIYNDVRLSKVTSLAAMTAGTTYYDSANTTLYAWLSDGADPNGIAEITSRTNCVLASVTSGYVVVDGLHVVHGRTTGISLNTADTVSTPTLCRVTNNLAERCGLDAVVGTASDGILCYGPYIDKNDVTIDGLRATNYLIENNIVRDCFNNAVEVSKLDDSIIRNNKSYKCGGNLIEYWTGCSNNICERNYCEDAIAYGLPAGFHQAFGWVAPNGTSTGNIFKSNIAKNLGLRGIDSQQGTTTMVYNILLDCRNRGINFTAGTAIVNNNIVGGYNGTDGQAELKYINFDVGVTVTSCDNNQYFESTTGGSGNIRYTQGGVSNSISFTTWKADTGFDTNGFDTDPLLDSDYKPQSGSDALGGGVAVSGVTHDYNGTAWHVPPDIGAYQSVKPAGNSSIGGII